MSLHHGGVPALPVRRRTDVQDDPAMLIDSVCAEERHGEPDWQTIMQICDLCANNQRDAFLTIDAVKTKLRSKSHGPGLLAVILLEALVKNCPTVHDLVATPDVMEAHLIKALPRSIRKPSQGPSLNSLINEPGDQKSPLAIARWEAILRCVASWAHAFDAQKYPIFHECHRMLERRGVRFPQVEKTEDAPVFLKPAARPPVAAGAASSRSRDASPAASAGQQRSVGSSAFSAPPAAAPARTSGAAADCKQSLETARLFKDMLLNSEEGFPLVEDELVQQLYAQNRSNAGVLSQRLTRAANDANSVDESVMMQLLSTHESVLEVLKLYENIVSGKVKPATARAAQNRVRGDDDDAKSVPAPESKEDEHRRRAEAGFAQPRSQQLDPLPAAQAAPARTRRKSDLPPELQSFDMLGISPDAPAVASASPVHAVPQPHPSAPSSAADPFDAFPPASNPFNLSVSTHAPVAADTHAASSTKRSVASPMLAPPPTSATRSRKDKHRGSTELAGSPLGQTPTQQQQQHPTPSSSSAQGGLNLDLLLSAQAPASSSAPNHAAPMHEDFFGSVPQAAFPFSAGASFQPTQQQPQQQPNVFDAFNAQPSAHAAPFAAAAPFGDDAPPMQSDPFADMAPVASQQGASQQQQRNPFDF